MDDHKTIPQYRLVSYYGDPDAFEKSVNRHIDEGYEVEQFSTCGCEGTVVYTALMTRRISRLEVLVVDGKVVK